MTIPTPLEQIVGDIFQSELIKVSLQSGNHPVTVLPDLLNLDARGNEVLSLTFARISDTGLESPPMGFEVKGSYYQLEHNSSKDALSLVRGQQKRWAIYVPLTATKFSAEHENHRLPSNLFGLASRKDPLFLTLLSSSGWTLWSVEAKNDQPVLYREPVPSETVSRAKHIFDASSAAQQTPAKKQWEAFWEVKGVRSETKSEAGPVDADFTPKARSDRPFDWQDRQSIVDYLDRYIIGQNVAKRQLAVVFAAYMKRVATDDSSLPKLNTLLLGPSGVGKTALVQLLAEKLEVPYLETKVSDKSTSGLVGENLGYIFSHLRGRTKGKAPYAVVFLDELDKIAAVGAHSANWKGPGLQNEIVGWIEGATVGGSHDAYTMDTRNMLFVAAGAFQGLSGVHGSLVEVIAKRLGVPLGTQQEAIFANSADERWINQIGQKDQHSLLKEVTPEDLITYGLVPELVGRLPVTVPFHSLTIEDKVRILMESERSPMKKHIQFLASEGYRLILQPEAAQVMAELCPPETGARALEHIAFKALELILFEPKAYARNNVITITSEVVKNAFKNN